MRILMVGDVVGKAGRTILLEQLPQIKEEYRTEFVIVNGENAAAGIGITPEIAHTFLKNGVDVITLGNHAWNKRDIFPMLDSEARLLRPANFPPGAPGRGWGIFPGGKERVGVVSLQGRTFMDPTDDPFRKLDAILEEIREKCRILIIDFHAEATSEKQAFGIFADGRATAVIGTHTHIQTADERILPEGTAYLTDVGMTGPIHSVIGMNTEIILERFTTLLPARFEVAEGEAQLSAVLIDADPLTGKAVRIKRLQIPEFNKSTTPSLD